MNIFLKNKIKIMKFKKIIFILILIFPLFGCQDLKKGFSKTKIDQGEEFLIKKKIL